MVPNYESDLAAERWAKAEWENYELWEKVEGRLRRRKRIWVVSAVALFVLLCSIPTLMDRWSKWHTLRAVRELAQEINRLKTRASVDRVAYRLSFEAEGHLAYRVERMSSCTDTGGQEIQRGQLLTASSAPGYALLDAASSERLGIPGLVREFCYDYLSGNGSVLNGKSVIGFGVSPVKDLSEGRSDRVSLLLLTGPSAEISFD